MSKEKCLQADLLAISFVHIKDLLYRHLVVLWLTLS